jgi:4-hydroxy-3-methylbut-2-enyl diphosphate reductase
MKVILAQPRGVCAGVDRAVAIVERALELYSPPIYVRKEIVHNRHTVERFRERGVVFVDELEQVPADSVVIFSAHGVSPSVKTDATTRSLTAIDATCPLVSKVHSEVKRFVKQGYQLVLIGHAGHEEVEGTLGHAPEHFTLVEDVAQAETVQLSGDKLMVLTQTTLSVDDTARIMGVLKRRYPQLSTPKADDICYATQNRQDAIKALCEQVDRVLVVGSKNSSNSNRLVDVAIARGIAARLIDGPEDIDESWLQGAQAVGVSAGASTPEVLVQKTVAKLQALGAVSIETLPAAEENVVFQLPKELKAQPGSILT